MPDETMPPAYPQPSPAGYRPLTDTDCSASFRVIRTGLDVARALALGADLGGLALPIFRAHQDGGVAGARTAMETIIAGVRQAFALTGSKSIEELRRKPRVVIGELRDWLDALV